MRLSDKMDFKLPIREQNSHKGTFGKVLNIAGSENYTGAAYLSSLAALRVGCGYVTLASSPKVVSAVSALTPDIVYLPLSELKNNLGNYSVVSIGCGLSVQTATAIMFKSVINELASLNIPVVIDASGLTLLSKIKGITLPEKLVITPHPAEASRLLKVEVEKILNKPDFYVKKLAKTYNCVAVLKGHNTRVVSVDGEVYVNNTGNSALAKAGSGDVLCGMITGFIAQGVELFEAAKLAVFLHGKTGELAANALTEYSVLASDLLNFIPKAIADVQN